MRRTSTQASFVGRLAYIPDAQYTQKGQGAGALFSNLLCAVDKNSLFW